MAVIKYNVEICSFRNNILVEKKGTFHHRAVRYVILEENAILVEIMIVLRT